jgi:hypothetical protein
VAMVGGARETKRGRTSAELGALASILKHRHDRQATEAARGHDRGTGGEDTTSHDHRWPTRQAGPANTQADDQGHPGHGSVARRAWCPRPKVQPSRLQALDEIMRQPKRKPNHPTLTPTQGSLLNLINGAKSMKWVFNQIL